jgi:hypothetical protein
MLSVIFICLLAFMLLQTRALGEKPEATDHLRLWSPIQVQPRSLPQVQTLRNGPVWHRGLLPRGAAAGAPAAAAKQRLPWLPGSFFGPVFFAHIRFPVPLAQTQSSLRTKDPASADLFFVPIYGECFLWIYEMLQHVGHDKAFSLTNDFFMEAITILKRDVRRGNKAL